MLLVSITRVQLYITKRAPAVQDDFPTLLTVLMMPASNYELAIYFHSSLTQFEALVERLIHEEVDSTSDPNTIFRGNSVASKVIDEFMKVVGSVYLHHTLQTCIDEVRVYYVNFLGSYIV